MRPKYYKNCSSFGRKLLIASNFPYIEYLDKECLLIIQRLGNDFDLGNALKYLWRLGNKNRRLFFIGGEKTKDLKKAKFYLNRYIIRNNKEFKSSWEVNLLNLIDKELGNL